MTTMAAKLKADLERWCQKPYAELLAWIAVALGCSLLLVGWSGYRNDLKAFDCAHAKLDSESLDKLFAAADVPSAEWDKWDVWATQHDASISWSVSSGTFAPGGITLETGRTWADEVSVGGCNGSLLRGRYARRPDLLQERRAELGVGVLACGLLALGVLRWWFKGRPEDC
jgi:hypothetical protein